MKYLEPNTVGFRLRELRRQKKLSLSELGKLAGCPGGSISKWEIGDHAMPVPLLIKICNALGCSADYLLGLRPQVAPQTLPVQCTFSTNLNPLDTSK